MPADYRQADLDEARELAPEASTKAQERIAKALADRERKGAAKLVRDRELRLVHKQHDELDEVLGG